ncbi:hypothetical protein [aff. Roholtiella sp. LEGE 12411]|uniref:hypothetical protein n=1 Tax=aff. Roholtiella sp. LEGE 12411 TaxID=1828822 RepID=UPI00187E37AC|nr:hypothetical protein [aff. Roholtiella sp. LEGE 12411]MBE9037660.1 hypothetical protein [aff. Roholtiella sp. LEGE 12411]
MTTIQTQELTKEQIQKAVDLIIDRMPPQTTLHREALAEFRNGNYPHVKKLAAFNPLDQYCKALSFLGGAFSPQAISTGNTFTILNESILKVGELAKERTALELGADIAEVFG